MADTILVTGGAGYVGSHVVVELARAGYAVAVLDNFANSTPAVLPRLAALAERPIPCVEADVRDVGALRARVPRPSDHGSRALRRAQGGWRIRAAAAHLLRRQRRGCAGALEVMGEAGVATLVFSSSATVYGQPDQLPVTEDAPLAPQSVYGRTKRVVEDFLRDLARANPNWRIAILRYFNPAGAHPSGLIGEAPTGRPEQSRAPSVADRRRRVLRISRSSAPIGPRRTGPAYAIIFTSRTSRAATSPRLRYLAKHPGALTLNLGLGRGHSVLDVVAAFERACGRRITRTLAPRRPGDIASCYADPARAEALLRWRATRGLDAICADAWRWQQSGGRY